MYLKTSVILAAVFCFFYTIMYSLSFILSSETFAHLKTTYHIMLVLMGLSLFNFFSALLITKQWKVEK